MTDKLSFTGEIALEQRTIDAGLREFRRQTGEISTAFMNFWRETKKESAIPQKYKELIQLSIVLTQHCKPCIFSHVKLCLKSGATKAEILDAATQALAVGGGIVYEYIGYMMEALNDVEEQS
jgi:AhpD family alkylhydroperoxidase